MNSRRFFQLDVFTARPLQGNPLAVVADAQGLSDADMAAFARWTNLSETTFLLPPTDAGCDYRLRIFTPGGELPFAGHPTLGSAQAWLAAGGRPRQPGRLWQQCGVGTVEVRLQGSPEGVPRLAFGAPPCRRRGPVAPALAAQAARALRLAPEAIEALEWVDNGPGWMAARLRSAAEVLALEPDFAAMPGLKLGVVGRHAAGAEADVEVRAFVPDLGVPEDPVTGSLNAGLAQWLIESGWLPPRYTAAQGAALGRAGRVHVQAEGTEPGAAVWIGGDVCTLIDGRVKL